MFKITTNRTIMIDKGDDSGKFPLFINKGTAAQPIRYEFLPRDVELIVNSSSIKSYTVDIDKFKRTFNQPGNYSFSYTISGWVYQGNLIDINSLGIKYVGYPQVTDSIVATVSTTKEEVYFYISEINSPEEEVLVKKTFTRNGYITTEYKNKPTKYEFDYYPINSYGDIQLRISSSDTEDIEAGEYRYSIRAKLYNKDYKSYEINTIVESHPLYVIDFINENRQNNYEEEFLTNVGYASLNNEPTGGGGVESVNGYTGVVVLNYEDVGASEVSVSALGTATDEIEFITVNGVESKIKNKVYSGASGIIVNQQDQIALKPEFYNYLDSVTYQRPTIAVFNILNSSGTSVSGNYEIGTEVSVAKV